MDEAVVSTNGAVAERPENGFRWYVVAGGVVFGSLMLGGGLWLGKMMYASPVSNVVQVTAVSPIPTSVSTNSTTNWNIYAVNSGSPKPSGIKYSLPTNIINPPKWANAGHYYQSATLPGNTELGVFLIGQGLGFSPSYDQFVGNVITKHNLTQMVTKIGDKSAIKFSGQISDQLYSQDLLILGEGEGGFRGAVTKIDNNTSLYVLLYQDKNNIGVKDFASDSNLFDQILSTFKFTDNTTSIENWKTYTSTRYGYSIKYPGDYFKYQDTLLPSGDGIFLATSVPQGGRSPKFLGPTDVWFGVVTVSMTNSNIQSLDQYIASQTMLNAQKTPGIIGGVSGYRITYQLPEMSGSGMGTGASVYEGLLSKNNNLYTISLSCWDKATLDSDKFMFDQILSTFTFIK